MPNQQIDDMERRRTDMLAQLGKRGLAAELWQGLSLAGVSEIMRGVTAGDRRIADLEHQLGSQQQAAAAGDTPAERMAEANRVYDEHATMFRKGGTSREQWQRDVLGMSAEHFSELRRGQGR